MLRFTIFPNLHIRPDQRANPYIQDFIQALNHNGNATVVNPSHKNPLLSLLPPKHWGDIFVFNWFESIPDFKYGILQSIIAFFYLLLIRICGKKIIWIYHNKRPHAQGKEVLKRLLANLIAHQSYLIITHAQEGVELIKRQYPFARHKVHFLNHPTKDRTILRHWNTPKQYDLLIWGQIARYKGVFEFVQFLKKHSISSLRVCIAGGCTDSLFQELQQLSPESVTLVHQGLSFEELATYIDQSEFILAPYAPETVLSSGMLMDSLSYGTKVIGPNVGSFHDYAQLSNLNVYTFQSFQDIPMLVKTHRTDQISLIAYQQFLQTNNWDNYVQTLIQLIQK